MTLKPAKHEKAALIELLSCDFKGACIRFLVINKEGLALRYLYICAIMMIMYIHIDKICANYPNDSGEGVAGDWMISTKREESIIWVKEKN